MSKMHKNVCITLYDIEHLLRLALQYLDVF